MTTSSPDPALPAHRAGPVEIIERSYDHPDAACLVRALYEEQVGRYGFADPVDADPTSYVRPNGLFVVVYVGEAPSACGGCRSYDPNDGVVEIKKMYTVPHLRDTGLGSLVLAWLEQQAARHGARRALLETGARSHAALALVRRAGYQPAPRYVDGRDPSINRAFFKDLADLSTSSNRDDLRAIAR
jgi:GNAT superfamily N-acetyltransferase